ncbi:uncharacterized protein [Cherax quadricarinatus]|nr:uncharacterized protein LOC128684949 isoform X1 [Cherax quadricarinatus]XP_053627303.1 uncharacterized protein LOC128684949 isoform X1 [Cherax quadricarinatus]XP_053627304.1 uncharacterized protein LOC128684949 isoform X1 [Cherax quadricarinatus]XP_053627305.1 uncharacterized protein LOC128684949 isoform X1 [Cherax quadricarinatus]XP_053627306.1 uncharacterized protein LOC128684949 isoform X1 [Cherax quadricarinatus]XP_053627307.1 uncharacterized protein LOC128684949 isoform X1 [Cherax quad
MKIFKVMLMLAVTTLAADAFIWPDWLLQPAIRRRPQGMRSSQGGSQFRRQELHHPATHKVNRREPRQKATYPTRQQSQGPNSATLTMVRAATNLGLGEDPEFTRQLCMTTDVCPYSWQWIESNMLRAIVRWSLLR